MRFLYLFLLVLFSLSLAWSQPEGEDYQEIDIDDIEAIDLDESDYEYEYEEPYEPVFDLEAVQEEPIPDRQFDLKKWEALREANDYTAEGKPKELKKRDDSFSAPQISESFGSFFKVIMYGLLIVVIALFLYLLLRPQAKNRKLAKATEIGDINLENLEENLDRADVNAFITDAEASGDYQLAVRLHFLACLKKLSEEEILKWKKDKTNRTYLRELRQAKEYKEFRRLTLIYERIWYGRQTPDQNRYQQLQGDYVAFRQSIKTSIIPSESHAE